jgi:hypothetical protein
MLLLFAAALALAQSCGNKSPDGPGGNSGSGSQQYVLTYTLTTTTPGVTTGTADHSIDGTCCGGTTITFTGLGQAVTMGVPSSPITTYTGAHVQVTGYDGAGNQVTVSVNTAPISNQTSFSVWKSSSGTASAGVTATLP